MGALPSSLKADWLADAPASDLAAHCDGLLVAYSGGVDSTVLLGLLVAARNDGSPPFVSVRPALAAVHVHHGLLTEADGWAQHAKEQCAAWGVPCFVKRVRVDSDVVQAKGLEAAARAARYQAIADVARCWGDELRRDDPRRPVRIAVVLAHHRDDQVETFWFRLLRGAGVRGLTAMAPWAPMPMQKEDPSLILFLWRPLLALPKAWLIAYAQKQHLFWVEDPTNATYGEAESSRFRRNLLRQRLLPELRRFFPGVDRVTLRTIETMNETQRCLDDLAVQDDAALTHPAGGWHAQHFFALAAHRQHNLIRWAIHCQRKLPPPQARLIAALRQLASATTQRQVALTPAIALAADRERIWLMLR
jgi:tRNA(Ile)-lysidine synthase